MVDKYCYTITYKGGAIFRVFIDALIDEKEAFEHFLDVCGQVASYDVYLLTLDD